MFDVCVTDRSGEMHTVATCRTEDVANDVLEAVAATIKVMDTHHPLSSVDVVNTTTEEIGRSLTVLH